MSNHMIDVEVKNKELLNILNRYARFLTEDTEAFAEDFHLGCRDHKDQRHFLAGEGHLNEIVEQGERHEGFPDSMYGYELTVSRKNHQYFSENCHPTQRLERTSELGNMQTQIMEWLGVRNCALTAYYPPGGFISWHNNANAAAYNLIFTWSEDGNGQFDYLDPVTKEVVTMPDKKGWQCKAAYFGHYGEPERLMYHSAKTDCWRCTVSFTFDTQDLSEVLRHDLIEEISSEE